jgi:hypothetical protein
LISTLMWSCYGMNDPSKTHFYNLIGRWDWKRWLGHEGSSFIVDKSHYFVSGLIITIVVVILIKVHYNACYKYHNETPSYS